jgi:hypothetical protein
MKDAGVLYDTLMTNGIARIFSSLVWLRNLTEV